MYLCNIRVSLIKYNFSTYYLKRVHILKIGNEICFKYHHFQQYITLDDKTFPEVTKIISIAEDLFIKSQAFVMLLIITSEAII